MNTSYPIQSTHKTAQKQSRSQRGSYLMCPPDYFGIFYEINPWMSRQIQPDFDLAKEQWWRLISNLREAGATIEFMQPIASLPDMVFTADIGLVNGSRFIMSQFRYRERQPEAEYAANWFRAQNYEVTALSLEANVSFESSDLLSFRDCLFAGYGFRSDLPAHSRLALHFKKIFSVKLIDPRLYHLDTCFCTLDDRRAMITPDALTRRSCTIMKKLIPEPLVLDLDEALTFCANSLVVGETVIMPCCPSRVGRILEKWGFNICVSPVSEFLKAGGAVHCLTLVLGS